MLKLLFFFASVNPGAWAQSLSTTNQSTLSVDRNPVVPRNPEITDVKLKAESGAASRYSLKTNLLYMGPPVNDLSAPDQPNPDGSVGTYQTVIIGNIGGRYRMNSQSAISLSGGLKMVHPFHGMDRQDVNNPSLTFDYTSKVRGIQMRQAAGVMIRTVPEYLAVGQKGLFLDNQSMVYDIPESGFSLGLELVLSYYFYDRSYRAADGKAPQSNVDVCPGVKYNITDKLNVSTATLLSWWNPRSTSDGTVLLNKSLQQKIGLAYGVSSDFYVSPFILFFPQGAFNPTLNVATIFSVY